MPRVQAFVANTSDDRHCFQASYTMVVNSLLGDRLSMRQAEVETDFRDGQSTWAFRGMISLAEKGLAVIYIEMFDVEAFICDPKSVLIELYGSNIADRVERRTDLSELGATVKEWIANENIEFQNRTPVFEDLRILVEKNYYIIANVNYNKLTGIEGYNGHFVVIEEIYKDAVRLQNPGLPPLQSQICKLDDFVSAWMYPDSRAANIIAIRRKV